MSICSLKGFNIRLCRQAFILAHRDRVSVLLSPGGGFYTRRAHNSLYQMVKKRTLEARSKQQPNKFPNNQACVSQNSSTSQNSQNSSNPSSPSNPCSPKSPSTRPPTAPICPNTPSSKSPNTKPPLPMTPGYRPACPPNPSSPNPLKQPSEPNPPTSKPADTDKTGPTKPKVCQNSSVLSAANCNVSSKIGGGGVGDGSGGPAGGAGGKDGDLDKNSKLLFGLLAALGASGLLLWLLTRRKSKDGSQHSQSKSADFSSISQSIPATSAELPKHVPYLLIGGGTASFSAFRAIKSNDARAKVLMITNEFRKPYMRPPLSKELWYSAQQVEPSKDYRFKQWTGAERSLFFEPDEFFVHPAKLMESANGGIAVAQGFTVRKIDPNKRIVTLTDGYEITYDECLIATGCSSKNLEVFSNAPPSVKERVMIYRTPDDFERLKQFADEKKSITIVGNGFTGSELACSMANYCKDRKVKIYQVFPENGVMSKVLPDYLSKWTTRKVEELGVCVLPNAGVLDAKRDDVGLQVALNNGTTLLTDIVVVCVGCEANTGIANLSGLEVDRSVGGFVVNAELQARANLFVAGDASCFYDPLLGRRRVEHHDHSVVSGRLAGENMVGKKKSYAHQSMFWSDLGPEIGYEGIGLVDASLPTVGVFALPSKVNRTMDNLTETRPESMESLPNKELPDVNCDPKDEENYGRGVIFYLKNDKIVGILLWNLFNRIGLARTIINQNKKYDDLNEVAKLFEIHS